MKSLTKYYLVLLTATLASCTLFTSYKEEANQCDLMLSSLDSIQSVYNGIDFAEVERIGKIVESEMTQIKQLLTSTGYPLNKEDAIFLGRYKSISKPYRKLAKTRKQLEFDLELCEKQLNNLKQDIDNKKIEKAILPINLKSEQEALNIVIHNIDNFLQSKASITEEFEKDKEEIKRIFKAIEGK